MARSLNLRCGDCSQGSSGWVGLICLGRFASQIFDSDKTAGPKPTPLVERLSGGFCILQGCKPFQP